MPRGRYYLGRVIKTGQLNNESLLTAIRNAPSITLGKFTWTITEVHEGVVQQQPFIYGELCKFSQEGHVTVVDTDTKSQVDAIAPNLLGASSPFVYLPEYSGIAYLHVWNGIQQELFPRRFKAIIEAYFQNFFVDCDIESISDYRAFSAKLRGLEKFTELSAKVHPPNPLFGSLWKELKDYMAKRASDEVSVRETQNDGNGIQTQIVVLIENILDNPRYESEETPDITDAALLMAADGYRIGKVVGEQEGTSVVIRTSDTQKNFLFDKSPDPDELADQAVKSFKQISDERNLEHP